MLGPGFFVFNIKSNSTQSTEVSSFAKRRNKQSARLLVRRWICYHDLMTQKRSIVIFDGSNFYFKLKALNLPHKSRFKYLKFSQWLSKSSHLIDKYYAIGEYRAKPTDPKPIRHIMSSQQEFLRNLEKDGFAVQLGFLLKSDGKYHEKGVDVQLAVDLMKGAYKDEYDIAYLVSSDTDLLPAIHEAQATGKTVCYIGFRHQISYALYHQCKRHQLLTKDDLLPFI